ncbi:MAG: hypothetical protein HC801_03930 [Nitrospira sp.]|nr:hypothetical protein [Nitrospira sp.]
MLAILHSEDVKDFVLCHEFVPVTSQGVPAQRGREANLPTESKEFFTIKGTSFARE